MQKNKSVEGSGKKCPKCTELVGEQDEVCPFCNYSFEAVDSRGEGRKKLTSKDWILLWMIVAIGGLIVIAIVISLLIKK
jgi:uncharacterized membrane protein YvbJ